MKNRIETIENDISKAGGIKKAYKELNNFMNWIVNIKKNGKWNHRRHTENSNILLQEIVRKQ